MIETDKVASLLSEVLEELREINNTLNFFCEQIEEINHKTVSHLTTELIFGSKR